MGSAAEDMLEVSDESEARDMAVPGSGAMFDRIATRYDTLNRLMSVGLDRGWRRKAIAALDLPINARVRDGATGTGDVAVAAARESSTARILGIDPSSEMLRLARAKVERLGLEAQIEFQTGDAESLPFDDESFDAATIAFGIRNVPDRIRGLAELSRVTRRDGRIAILEAIEPASGVLAFGARLWVHHLIPRFGALLSGAKEYRYLQSSIADFPSPSQFEAMMLTAGIVPIQRRVLGCGACCLFVGSPAREKA